MLAEQPEVLPGILWEWTKTTNPPEGEAPVEPYFSGIAGCSVHRVAHMAHSCARRRRAPVATRPPIAKRWMFRLATFGRSCQPTKTFAAWRLTA